MRIPENHRAQCIRAGCVESVRARNDTYLENGQKLTKAAEREVQSSFSRREEIRLHLSQPPGFRLGGGSENLDSNSVSSPTYFSCQTENNNPGVV